MMAGPNASTTPAPLSASCSVVMAVIKGLTRILRAEARRGLCCRRSGRFLRQLQGNWQRRRACGSARSAHVEPAWFGRSSCRLRCRGCLSIWQQDGIGEQLEGAAIEEHRRRGRRAGVDGRAQLRRHVHRPEGHGCAEQREEHREIFRAMRRVRACNAKFIQKWLTN